MNDFQQAAAIARARYTEMAWAALPVRTQAELIYAELRRLDAAQAAAQTVRRKPRMGQRSVEAHVSSHKRQFEVRAA